MSTTDLISDEELATISGEARLAAQAHNRMHWFAESVPGERSYIDPDTASDRAIADEVYRRCSIDMPDDVFGVWLDDRASRAFPRSGRQWVADITRNGSDALTVRKGKGFGADVNAAIRDALTITGKKRKPRR